MGVLKVGAVDAAVAGVYLTPRLGAALVVSTDHGGVKVVVACLSPRTGGSTPTAP